MDTEFDDFWEAYPRKVGKLAAQRAYVKARKTTSAQALLDGVERYIDSKPEWQHYAFPASWLNAGRWMDELPERRVYEPWLCPHTPHCPHRTACAVVSARPAVTT